MLALLLIGISLYGTAQRLNDLHPNQYALLTRPDMRAAAWLKCGEGQNTNILVNSFFAYGGSLLVGSDGGWWLPVLTKCDTTLPPLNYGTEKSFEPNYKKWVNELATSIFEKGITQPDVVQMLQDRGITHVYIGQQHGQVNYNGPAVLDPHQLADDPHFRVIYHQDRVWILEVGQLP